MDETKTEKAKELISFGADITGAAAGGAIGFIVAGPVGAIGGAVAGSFLTKSLEIVADFAMRDLSRREKVKAGAGLAFAYDKIVRYLDEGHKPRDDGFFERSTGERSASDEILEGILFKCRNEFEEKKLKFIGNIYANTAFMPEVTIAGANWLLQKSSELTYRQLCMIAIIEQKKNKGVSWGPHDGDPAFQMEYKHIDDMLERDHSPDSVRSYNETGEGLWVIGLSRVGKFCYEVMGLKEIPADDLEQLKLHFPRAFE
jgi:hypothetical protein